MGEGDAEGLGCSDLKSVSLSSSFRNVILVIPNLSVALATKKNLWLRIFVNVLGATTIC